METLDFDGNANFAVATAALAGTMAVYGTAQLAIDTAATKRIPAC